MILLIVLKQIFLLQLDILEYIHFHGYSHSDIKDSNLLLGIGANQSGQVHLLDYGLASKYVDRLGQHKEYRQDLRKAHDGTMEYTSRDAHIGGNYFAEIKVLFSLFVAHSICLGFQPILAVVIWKFLGTTCCNGFAVDYPGKTILVIQKR